MKNYFAVAVVISLLFFSACQENITTVADEGFTKPNPQIIHDKIPICCEVCDPLSGVCRANGCVEYTHQIISWTNNPDGLIEIQLDLQMLSKLCNKCMMMHPEWLARGYSQENFS